MRLMKVKRKTHEQKVNEHLTVRYLVMNVCEMENNGNKIEFEFYQIYSVVEIWNFPQEA